jgi:hypothetical protein
MKRFLLAAVLTVTLAASADSLSLTNETLVLTTATALPQLAGRKAIAIQNRGPNSIFCAVADSTKAVVNKSWEIASGGWFSIPISSVPIYCIAATANQVTGAATITIEVK